MPLIDYQTRFTKLKYGRDRFGERAEDNSSKQPYIKDQIPDEYLGKTGGDDFLLRGGTLVPRVVGDDLSRLTKLMLGKGTPKGPLYIAKQNMLSLTNVNSGAGIKSWKPTEKKTGIGRFFQQLAQGIADLVPLNQGIYSPLNTLASVAGSPIGARFVKQGYDPTLATNALNPFSFGSDPEGNLPLALPTYLRTMFPNGASPGSNDSLTRMTSLLEGMSEKDLVGKTFLKYSGGPGAYLGIGKTRLKTPVGSNTIYSNGKAPNNFFTSGVLNGTPKLVMSQTELLNYGTSFAQSKTGETIIKDFQKVLFPSGNKQIPNTLSYIDKNFSQRVNLGDPGIKGNKKSYTIGKRIGPETRLNSTVQFNSRYDSPGIIDKVNRYPLYKSSEVKTTDPLLNDFVKFRIGVIDNDDPGKKTYIHFRAIIDSFNDNYSADWESTKFMGRGENFYKYKGFNRDISLAWTVAAQSKGELIPMYQKLNYLASVCAPSYSPSGYMRGNLITLTLGGWCYEQPGYMSGLSLDVPTESPWELALPDGAGTQTTNAGVSTDPSVKEMPMMVKVSGFKFTPIHNFVPQIQQNDFDKEVIGGFINKYGNEKYISLRAASGDNYNQNNVINENYTPKAASDAYRGPRPTAVSSVSSLGINNPEFDIQGNIIT